MILASLVPEEEVRSKSVLVPEDGSGMRGWGLGLKGREPGSRSLGVKHLSHASGLGYGVEGSFQGFPIQGPPGFRVQG